LKKPVPTADGACFQGFAELQRPALHSPGELASGTASNL